MIFIIPIILGAAALASAVAGVTKGAEGVSKMKEADQIGKESQARYESVKTEIEKEGEITQELAEEYGQLQLDVKCHTVGRFVKFAERIGQRASQSELPFLEEIEISPEQIQEFKAEALEAERFASGGVKAIGAAYAAGQGTLALVGLFGTASTGAAIGGLSGAAAWNATLAWFGGGAIATGGGGMALGTLVLGGITVGPALAIGGFVLAGQGEKALTEARKYQAKVNTEIAKLRAFKDFLGQAQNRVAELRKLLKKIDADAVKLLDELESSSFDKKEDAAKFQQAYLLVKALVEIMKTPVLDTDGNLNSDVVKLQTKYRNI